MADPLMMRFADVSRVRHLRALSSWAVVAAASSWFGVLAAIITWGAATQRRGAWVAAVPQIYADETAQLARQRQWYPNLTSGPDLATVTNYLPDPATALGALGAQVLVQTMFFAAACALMVVLKHGGRPIWASLAPAVTVGGVVISAGPLGLLPGTLAGQLTRRLLPGMSDEYFSYVAFAAPLWWRLVVAAVAALPFAGAWLLTRRPHQRQPVALWSTLSALGLFGLVVEVTVLAVPQTLVPDGDALSEALPTFAALLVVGCCAAVAGSTGTLRRGAVVAVAAALAGAAVWFVAWIVYRNDDGRGIFAWEQTNEDPIMWLGTWPLVALVLAAGGLGWATGAARQGLKTHAPSGLKIFDRPESPSLPT